ncbi:Nucleotidylyl transferase [Westerdykella ornata]|uniref:arginine--tRNA ligase n=1 Tax=Westerdykella ornata TaxID=318751 RepID=A0A6A6JWC9_WESOR|nr:Nucleotidylyl transferase [Westerdykella ornata]KAF2280930.1 Nucleotidylyl transferase [Westerdykella ornata]
MATLSVTNLERLFGELELSTPIPQFASSDIRSKPLDLYRSYLAELICGIVDCDPTAAYSAVQLSNDPLHGDFTVVLPRLCTNANPKELAQTVIEKFAPNALFDLPWADGVYLRVCAHSGTLPRLLIPFIIERNSGYGRHGEEKQETGSLSPRQEKEVVVEFSSPNIASEFQAKHLRSTIIGEFISNIYQFMGWKVFRTNYLGDWGKDMALLGVGWENFGSEEDFEKDPVSHLLDVYHKIHQEFLPEQIASRKARDEAKKHGQDELEATVGIEGRGVFAERNAFFKRMEDGDQHALDLFKSIREVNIDSYAKFYGRLGITFDEYSGESQVRQETIAELEQALKDKGITEESGGASVIDMKKLGAKFGTAIVRDRTGSSTYFMRYLAAVLERSRRQEFDKMIFVAADKTGHFSRLIKVFEALGMTELAAKLEHVQLNDVSHMAEKLGHDCQPHNIIDQCAKAVRDVLKADEQKATVLGTSDEVVTKLGTTAILAQELSTKRGSDHAFDINSMASFKSGTGAYLQYHYAQLCSILKSHPLKADLTPEDYESLSEEEHTSLLLALGQYPEVVQATYKSLEPANIMAYLHTVAEKLTDCLDDDEDDEQEEQEGVRDMEEKGIGPVQSALFEATRVVLENGMRLLGLEPVAFLLRERADTPVAD